MATVRIQLRRGTAAEWTAVDPVLAAGEMGLETDTGDFKFGDGSTAWSALSYSLGNAIDDYIPLSEKGVSEGVATLDSNGNIPMSQLGNIIDAAPAALDTLAELSNALNNDSEFAVSVANSLAEKAPLNAPTFTGVVSLPQTTSIGSVTDTEIGYLSGTTSSIQQQINAATSDLSNHETATTSVHGITDTANLVYTDDSRLSDERIVPDNTVTTVKIVDSAVTTDKIADSNVTTAKIADDAITTVKILDSNILTDKIADSNVTTAKIADDAITTVKIADSNVTTDKIVDLGITAGKIADSAVTTQKIADSNVTTDKIADLNVTEGKINTGAVTELKIADGAVTSAKIANGTIVNEDISGLADIDQSKIKDLVSDLAAKALDADLDSHTGATTSVHGIADTSLLATTANVSAAQSAAESYADSAVTTHNSATTSVHGIADTSDIALLSANQTFSGNITISGDLVVSGTTTTVSATDLVVSDPLIYIGEGNSDNLVDLGIVSSFNDGTYQHSGLVRDASSNVWKLFKGVTDEPTTVINFAQGSLDDLAVGALSATTVTPSAGVVFSDGTQTKEGVPSITAITEKTSNYTLSALTERDTLIEVNHTGGTAVTITVPSDATVNFPVGTSIDILRTNTGEVTIAGSGATVNATPGLKLRAQWSSATLFKRGADSWVLFGDLKA